MIRLTLLLVLCLAGAMYFADTLPDPAPKAVATSTDTASVSESIVELINNVSDLDAVQTESDPVTPIPEQTASVQQDLQSIDAPSYLDLFKNPAVVDENGNLVLDIPVAETVEPAPTTQTIAAAIATVDDVAVRYVSGERVNVRAGPSTSEAVLSQVVYADAVQVLDETSDGWVHIRIEGDGVEGYMAGRFLQDTDPTQ